MKKKEAFDVEKDMVKKREEFNAVVNGYLEDWKGRQEKYREKKKAEESEEGVLEVGKLYDVQSVDVEKSAFKERIGEVKIQGAKVPAYKKFVGVVFDPDSMNFHVFPADSIECESLAKQFLKIQQAIKRVLKIDTRWTKVSFGTGHHKRQATIEEMCLPSEEKFKGHQLQLYKRITIKKGGFWYSINFMRYTFDGKKVGCTKVGCTMKEIQFHKSVGHINIGKDENGKTVFGICYTKDDKDGSCCKVGDNVCYNPPVRFPTSESDKNAINDIVKKFIDFINGTCE